MTKDSDDCERHASSVAECVSNKYLGGELIMLEESQGTQEEWDHYSEWVHVVLNHFLCNLRVSPLVECDLNYVVDYDEATDDKALADLDPVDARIDVDGIGAEDGDVSHIDIVDQTKVNVPSKEHPQELWNHHRSQAFVSHQKGEACNCWNNHLVAPLQINHIVYEAE